MSWGDLRFTDTKPSWDGLEDVVPESYKNNVKKYIEEADRRIDDLLKDESDLKERTGEYVNKAPIRNKKWRAATSSFKNAPLVAARRRLVLQCLSAGMTHYEVRDRLNLRSHTVQNDLNYMREKFKCKTNIELVAKAVRAGFIE